MISILIPIYKVEPYIERCIQSVVSQNYTDWELVLVDDCSPDKSAEKALAVLQRNQVSPSKYSIFRHSSNQGLAAARLTAIEHARGEYIWQVDSDDYIANGALQILWDIVQTSQADMVSMNYQKSWGEKELAQCVRWSPSSREETCLLLSGQATPTVWSFLIRRSLYTDNDIRPHAGWNYGEDFLVTPQLAAKANKIAHADEMLYHYTQENVGAMTCNLGKHHVEQLRSVITELQTVFQQDSFWKEALNAGIWKKRMELFMHAPYELYKEIETLPEVPLNTTSLDRWERYGALLAQAGCRNTLWVYSRCIREILHRRLKKHYLGK